MKVGESVRLRKANSTQITILFVIWSEARTCLRSSNFLSEPLTFAFTECIIRRLPLVFLKLVNSDDYGVIYQLI